MESVSKKQGKMLLMKLPDSLYQALLKAEESVDPSQGLIDVGVLKVNESSGVCDIMLNNTFSSQLKLTSIPMKLQPISTDESLYVFTVDGQNRAFLKCPLSMKIVPLGNNVPVYQSAVADVEPQITTYEADAKSQEPMRHNRVFHLHPEQRVYTMLSSEKAAEITVRKQRNEKRVRGDKETVKNDLFRLFHEKKYWKTKALADETDQPDQFINEILGEIAIKVEQGPHRKCWMLKPEYRDGDTSEEEDEVQKRRKL